MGNIRTVLDDNKSVIQANDYYPFGMAHHTYALDKNKYLYNGKELQDDVLSGTEFGNLDYGARFYDPMIGRWHVKDPLAEKYYGFSVYNYCINNPLKFIDYGGKEIFIYNWKSDGDGGGKYVKGHMDERSGKSFQTFAKTAEGYKALSEFAKAGQKFGDVEFTTDGKYADQELNFYEHSTYMDNRGGFSMRNKKDAISFDIMLNTNYRNDNDYGDASYLLTIGHEILLHLDQVFRDIADAKKAGDFSLVDKLIIEFRKNASETKGDDDHKGYIKGDNKYEKFRNYYNQLKSLYDSNKLIKAKKDHDAKYKYLLKEK